MTLSQRQTRQSSDTIRLEKTLKKFGVAKVKLIADTDLARVYKVRRPDGTPAALKLYYHSDMDDEKPGIEWLKALDGTAAVRVFDTNLNAVLMQWLKGLTLGEIGLSGQYEQADSRLVELAARHHRHFKDDTIVLPSVDHWFAALFNLRFDPSWKSDLHHNLLRASQLARRLIYSTEYRKPLHGDLHHFNVIATASGDIAIDPKGVLGDPAFELANAFRNPHGAGNILYDPARAFSLAKKCSRHLNISLDRQLCWAAAKCALSIAWDAEKGSDAIKSDAKTLDMLLSLCPAEPPSQAQFTQ